MGHSQLVPHSITWADVLIVFSVLYPFIICGMGGHMAWKGFVALGFPLKGGSTLLERTNDVWLEPQKWKWWWLFVCQRVGRGRNRSSSVARLWLDFAVSVARCLGITFWLPLLMSLLEDMKNVMAEKRNGLLQVLYVSVPALLVMALCRTGLLPCLRPSDRWRTGFVSNL